MYIGIKIKNVDRKQKLIKHKKIRTPYLLSILHWLGTDEAPYKRLP